MRPFQLTEFEEIFAENYLDRKGWPAGAFHYQLQFYQKLTREQENTIAEWLAYNCKENFIFAKDVGTLIAGGCSNNLAAWKSRKNRREPLVEYRVRLDTNDIWHFRMVWMT
jgi:hypothetical protein